jgi:hypothetical protein
MESKRDKKKSAYLQYFANNNWFSPNYYNYRNDMLHLPPYYKVRHLEGTGNFAVDSYYKFPRRIFYRHKLKMILDMMGDKHYYNILDFGCGKACIFKNDLCGRSDRYIGYEQGDVFNPNWKFNLIVCASVLEFVNLPSTLKMLEGVLAPGGEIIIASPMDTTLSYLYFKLIGDTKGRNTHNEIVAQVSKVFKFEKYESWMGLYFCLKARKK